MTRQAGITQLRQIAHVKSGGVMHLLQSSKPIPIVLDGVRCYPGVL